MNKFCRLVATAAAALALLAVGGTAYASETAPAPRTGQHVHAPAGAQTPFCGWGTGDTPWGHVCD